MAWLDDMGMTTKEKDDWRQTKGENGSALPIVCIACKRAEMKNAGYMTLYGMDVTLSSPSSIHEAGDAHMECPGVNVKNLFGSLDVYTFRGKRALKLRNMVWSGTLPPTTQLICWILVTMMRG